jgi:hypothetical protein
VVATVVETSGMLRVVDCGLEEGGVESHPLSMIVIEISRIAIKERKDFDFFILILLCFAIFSYAEIIP